MHLSQLARGAFVALAAIALSLFVPWLWPSPAAEAITNCSTNSASLDAAEQEMLRLHNEMRTQHGLSALTPSTSLNRASAWKSEDSSASGSSFSHTDSLGRNPSARARDCGYSLGAGENIAFGYTSAKATFDAWMNSPGHRSNILEPNFRAIGIGASGNAWTVKFGTVVESGATSPTPTATPTATAVPPTATPRLPASTPVIPTATPTRTPRAVTATVATPTVTPAGWPTTRRALPNSPETTIVVPALTHMATNGN